MSDRPLPRPVHPRLKRYLDPESAPRCPQCRYSLYRLSELVCPECGAELNADDLVAARWLADENAATRRVVRRERIAFWSGGLAMVGGYALLARAAGLLIANLAGVGFGLVALLLMMKAWALGYRVWWVAPTIGGVWLAAAIAASL